MKTELTPISELQPSDKIFVKWPADQEKPQWWKLPEILTVKSIELPNTLLVKETGGLCLKETEFHKVIDVPTPEAGDMITFDLEHYDMNGFKGYKEHTVVVQSMCYDPMKRHEPKCIVTVDGDGYGIPFSELKKIKKKQIKKISQSSQLELFDAL